MKIVEILRLSTVIKRDERWLLIWILETCVLSVSFKIVFLSPVFGIQFLCFKIFCFQSRIRYAVSSGSLNDIFVLRNSFFFLSHFYKKLCVLEMRLFEHFNVNCARIIVLQSLCCSIGRHMYSRQKEIRLNFVHILLVSQ